ncbi:MAG: DUF192 domain-containing protein [Treponema sp.]|nr:DUF192 domain-containing protein [Treponema sp.]
MRKIFAVFFFSLVTFLSCDEKLETRTLTIIRSSGSEITLKAEMARTESERNKGFMFRKKIPSGTGMLFLFPSDRVLSFWMKNTPTALSIAYIDSSGVIANIFDMTPFSTAPVTSTSYVRYALEVPKDWFSKEDIKPGDRLVLDFDKRSE